ncbi:MAG: methyltransferase domain-containing protein [Leptonema sp. (in: bacteria)]
MNLSSFKLIFIFLLLAILGGSYATLDIFQSYKFSFGKIIDHVDSFYFILIPLLTTFNLGFRFLRWNFLLRSFSIFVPSRKLLVYYFMSYLGNITPLYFLYFLRLIPFFKHNKIKSILIFLLDLSLDFLSVMLLFYFYHSHAKVFVFNLISLVVFFIIHYFFRSLKKINFLYNFSLYFFSLSFSIFIWYFTSFSLYLSLISFSTDINLDASIKIFNLMNLSNVFSFVPSGIYFSGKKVLEELIALGFPEEISIASFVVLRLFTNWTAVGISLLFFIYYRSVFLKRQEHFDFIVEEYKKQIPEHIQKKVLEKKIKINLKYLPKKRFRIGLDAGCGQGWYLKEMMSMGYTMYGVDASKEQVRYAIQNTNNKNIKQNSILSTKFPNNKFDFIYTINVLHHLKNREEQILALKEMYRILRRKGRLLIHEINVWNPIYKFYMSYIFPLINTIDEGTEVWFPFYESVFLEIGFQVIQIEFFTFLPDFLPYGLFKRLEPLEKKLEEIPSLKKFSAHFAIILEKL